MAASKPIVRRRNTVFAVLALAMAGYATLPEAAQATLRGRISYGEGLALPPQAVIDIELMDVSSADSPAQVARIRMSAEDEGPIPFELIVPSASIDQQRTYVLSARISYGGKLLYANVTQPKVLTQGAPAKVDLRVERVLA
ncbi:YbaY family lipoprotein [Niveibacterium sp. SC-1]|uniref:YbaY family lipoprotein n=1 Tax=Niveibacterium sp. SC-1 TaxID=3135646 RepID=UPI00311E9E7A